MIPAPLESIELLYLAKENPAKTGSCWFAMVEPKTLPAMAEAFLAAQFHLEDVSGMEAAEGAVSVYHFDHFDTPGRITVAALAPHDKPVFPSIAPVYYGAEWHERETRDFYGFVYDGNPNFIPLLLAADMADVHPLRKAEEARAALRVLFAAEDRGSDVVKKADGFTLLDQPEPEAAPEAEPVAEAAPAPAPAPVAEKTAEKKAGTPVAETAQPAAEARAGQPEQTEQAEPATTGEPKTPAQKTPSPKKPGGKAAPKSGKGGKK